MASAWIAALLACFIWWFSTGAILMVVKRADHTGGNAHSWSVIWGFAFLALGSFGFWYSMQMPTIYGTYIAFGSAILIWGWIELAFLSGKIMGPTKTPCPADAPEWERFIRAWGTIAYHEAALLAALLVMVYISQGAPNHFGIWTYAILFFARISAQLNLFFGVPKINTEFLPKPLAHLPSHFRIARLNWLFPFSITALTFAVACWLERLFAVSDPFQIVGFGLLTALTALALLEHWLMVLPLPDEKLWRWMLPKPENNTNDSMTTRTIP
jgi:putative photosynthetic complex assembly protein 2